MESGIPIGNCVEEHIGSILQALTRVQPSLLEQSAAGCEFVEEMLRSDSKQIRDAAADVFYELGVNAAPRVDLAKRLEHAIGLDPAAEEFIAFLAS